MNESMDRWIHGSVDRLMDILVYVLMDEWICG